MLQLSRVQGPFLLSTLRFFSILVLGMLDSWAAVKLWIIEFLAVSVLG